MSDKEALAAIEKELACSRANVKGCLDVPCVSCPHFVPPEKFFTALAVAAQVLREKVKPPEPLFTDDLMQMDGDPVWVEAKGSGVTGWYLVDVKTMALRRRHAVIWFDNPGAKDRFMFYRRKPEKKNDLKGVGHEGCDGLCYKCRHNYNGSPEPHRIPLAGEADVMRAIVEEETPC